MLRATNLIGFGAKRASGGGVVEFIGWASGYNSVSGGDVNPDLTSLTTDSYGIGGSLQQNDLVISFHSLSSSSADYTPAWSGYTEIADVYADDTADTNIAAAYKFMGSTPDTVVDLSANGYYADAIANRNDHVVALCFRGVDTTTPLDVTVTTATATNTGSVDAAAITPVTSGALVLALASGCQGNFFTSTITLPGSVDYEQKIDTFQVIGGGANNLTALAWAMVDNWTSGAVDIGTFTNVGNNFNSANESAAAITIALRPA